MRTCSFLISTLVSLTVSILYAYYFWNLKTDGQFALTEEYQLLPEDVILPRGMDIRINLETGEKWAKLPSTLKEESAMILIKEKENDEEKPVVEEQTPVVEHKQPKSEKWRKRYMTSSPRIEKALKDLEDPETPEIVDQILEMLEEEVAAVEVGAGLLHSTDLINLLKLLNKEEWRESALGVLSISLQNNLYAVERANQVKLAQYHLLPLFKEELSFKELRKLVHCLYSLLVPMEEDQVIDSDLQQSLCEMNVASLLINNMKRFIGKEDIPDRLSEMITGIIKYACPTDTAHYIKQYYDLFLK